MVFLSISQSGGFYGQPCTSSYLVFVTGDNKQTKSSLFVSLLRDALQISGDSYPVCWADAVLLFSPGVVLETDCKDDKYSKEQCQTVLKFDLCSTTAWLDLCCRTCQNAAQLKY